MHFYAGPGFLFLFCVHGAFLQQRIASLNPMGRCTREHWAHRLARGGGLRHGLAVAERERHA
jgi:hypothetical protein